jgi:hypothetical protein
MENNRGRLRLIPDTLVVYEFKVFSIQSKEFVNYRIILEIIHISSMSKYVYYLQQEVKKNPVQWNTIDTMDGTQLTHDVKWIYNNILICYDNDNDFKAYYECLDNIIPQEFIDNKE